MTHSIIPDLEKNDLDHERAFAQLLVGSFLTVERYTRDNVTYSLFNGAYAGVCPRGYVLASVEGIGTLMKLAKVDLHIDAIMVFESAEKEFTVEQAMLLAERNDLKNRNVPSVSRTLRNEILRLRALLAE